ncbi:hypothetical protein ACFYY8_31790 [Streptosporangium sp. NPDC001559]|uniref:hypothetical protein n=1 Tax=Streptosporangium sp. NPDC001559 TaxID=3366187 RepID=UPI0036E1EFC6
MPNLIDEVTAFASDKPIVTAIICVIGLALLGVAYLTARTLYRAANRFFHRYVAARPAEDALTIVAAAIATGVSAQGMWQFIDRIIDIHWMLQAAGFAFIEVAVITSAVRARRNMRENYSAGIDGIAVWALTGLSAVLSAMEAASLPEAVFRLAAPLVAAWLWERGMSIERRRATGRKRINWRLTPERMLVRVGLAETQDRTAAEVDAQRRLTKVALAADEARRLRDSTASAGKQRRALARMQALYAAAHAHTGLGRNEELQRALAAEVASLGSAPALLNVKPASAWMPEPEEPAEDDFSRLADETRNLSDALGVRDELRAMRDEVRAAEANIVMLARDVTSPATRAEVTSRVTGPVTESLTFVPEGWASAAPAVTPSATPAATSVAVAEPVTDEVTFNITDAAAYDITRALLDGFSVTPAATPIATSLAVAGRVTKKLTFPPKAERPLLPKTVIMRQYWDKVRQEENRYPGPVEIAKAAGAHHSLASNLRAEWVKELSVWERRKATSKKVAAVNGSRGGSTAGETR